MEDLNVEMLKNDMLKKNVNNMSIMRRNLVVMRMNLMAMRIYVMRMKKSLMLIKLVPWSKELILTPAFVQVNDDEKITEENHDEDYGNDFLNDHENVEDDDQGKCCGAHGIEVVHIRTILVKMMLKEGVYFSQFMCDLVVESFHKTLDQGTENLVDGCLNQK
ncbi:unnamed protein product [Lactuca saligna]|uniref:Uncharacterized protein n=1 Tax=Lactuca saligna TaxID=75948 RepID=A0AA36EK64_LACSI|nr:unnamed protein product [Lactuca saligna]